MPPYTVGGRYILLLREYGVEPESFYSQEPFSADGVYEVLDGKLESPSQRELGKQIAEKGPEGLRRELKKHQARE